jgi:hypothetical protein
MQELDHIAPPFSPFRLDLLPETPLKLIITKAGVQLRQVCRRLRNTAPPFTALQPRQYHGVRRTQFLAALGSPARLQHVTNLDLSKAPLRIISNNTLLQIATCCRHLRKLDLSQATDEVTASGIGALTSLASSLQVLDLGHLEVIRRPSQVQVLAQLTALRSLSVALNGAGRSQLQMVDPLTSLQLRVHLQPRVNRHMHAADVLPTLASLPLLVDLSLPEDAVWDKESAARLHGMVRLTALRVGCHAAEPDALDAEAFLIGGLAALTDLREVGLLLLGDRGLRALGRALGKLPLLSLEVDASSFCGLNDAEATALAEAIATRKHLTRLVLASATKADESVMHYEYSSMLHTLAALRVLELTNVHVHREIFRQLMRQKSLRSLSMRGWVDVPHPEDYSDSDIDLTDAPLVQTPYSGLSQLTQLCSLSCVYESAGEGNPLGEVASLTNLTQLVVGGNPLGVQHLWGLLPLQRLQLLQLPSGSSKGAPAMAALALLPALERVEYGGGACWSACDIRREVAAGAIGVGAGAVAAA